MARERITTDFKVADRMLECRDTMRRLFRERYGDAVMPYREFLRDAAKRLNVSTLEAVIMLGQEAKEDGTFVIWLCAAACEEIAP